MPWDWRRARSARRSRLPNVEVLDAQRQARDVETQAAIAEDALRRAQLDLLVAYWAGFRNNTSGGGPPLIE
jgi:hypothetical protein